MLKLYIHNGDDIKNDIKELNLPGSFSLTITNSQSCYTYQLEVTSNTKISSTFTILAKQIEYRYILF